MASINSLMGSTSSTGSIYGSRNTNIISGLASGLDTEAMIEGMVQGYQQKITKLQQERTTLQWQQEAYQSISDKLVEFARKYTSYTSDTNLFSSAFFNNAVITTTGGTYADLVSASGKTSSDVVLNGVAQLAAAAKYTVNNALGAKTEGGKITAAGDLVTLGDKTTVSTMDGTLTLTYGNQDITLEFGKLELFGQTGDNLDVDAFQAAVNEKLEEAEVSVGGTVYKASEVIQFEINDQGEVTLTDKLNAGNKVAISGATGSFADRVNNLGGAVDGEASEFSIQVKGSAVEEVDTADYLKDKTLSVTLNGQTKQIQLDGIQKQGNESFAEAFVRTVNERLGDAFGSGKLTAAVTADGRMTFTAAEGNTFSVSSTAGELLGMEDGALTSYLDDSRSLEDLLGTDANGVLNGLKAVGQDKEGRDLYALTINGVEIGQFTKDTALETVINRINSNTDAGVNVNYSQLTSSSLPPRRPERAGGSRSQTKAGTTWPPPCLEQWTRPARTTTPPGKTQGSA